jgi:hypothetical protein
VRRLLLLLLVAGCAAPLPTPDKPGASDAYRAALDAQAKGPRAREARERLEVAEWDRARAAHTVFAYRRFLQEFSNSHHAGEARQFLEGLRWAQAEREGSQTALAAYLEDEPRGAHAANAWTLLSAQRLEEALRSGSAPALRAWLAENPGASGRDRALAALDEADWRTASDPPAVRRYLDEHLDGAHRPQAEARLSQAARDEAEILEDDQRLRALDPAAADRVIYERAAALLDEGRLAQLARRSGPHAADAARDLAALQKDPRRAAALEAAAHKLFLPRATLDELPEAAPDRARLLREWALALDGRRLHRMLAEIASPRAQVGLAALDGVQALLRGLPQVEARVRAARELAILRPLAVDAPQLTAVALLEEGDAALQSARAAVGRNPRCAPAAWLAANLEKEPGLLQIASQTLRAQAASLSGAYQAAGRAGDASALGELCAALRAAQRAAEVLPEARPEAVAIWRLVEEGDRARGGGEACAGRVPPLAEERLEAARLLAGAGTPLARAALVRAAARDPDDRVRAAARGAVALDSQAWEPQ